MAFRVKLPENKVVDPDNTPSIYVLFGETMEGKSYLASQFPNPIVLSSDTNAEKLGQPAIDIKPIRVTSKDVKNRKSDFYGKAEMVGKIGIPSHLIVDGALSAIRNQNEDLETPFETLIIDVVDDLAQYSEEYTLDYVNEKMGRDEQYLGDYEHGVAWGRFNNFFLEMVNKIHGLEGIKYIVWISRATNAGTEKNPENAPALRKSLLNKINGEGDYMIECYKSGKSFKRKVRKKRKQIERDTIEDERIAEILDTVDGAYRDLTTEEKRAKNQSAKPKKSIKRKVVK